MGWGIQVGVRGEGVSGRSKDEGLEGGMRRMGQGVGGEGGDEAS